MVLGDSRWGRERAEDHWGGCCYNPGERWRGFGLGSSSGSSEKQADIGNVWKVVVLPNASSCARRTVRPNKLKHRGLVQRKVYCRAIQGEQVAHAQKTPELPEGFQQSIFKGQVRD